CAVNSSMHRAPGPASFKARPAGAPQDEARRVRRDGSPRPEEARSAVSKDEGPMRRSLMAIAVLSLLPSGPASAIVGGGEAPAEGPARAAVILVGPNGTCTGVSLVRDLVLTAGHCAPSGANLKLLEFDAARKPLLSTITAV